MPRESDISDDAASKDIPRVTRSLRKRLNSTDVEDSPIVLSQTTHKPSSASRSNLNSISEKESDLDNSSSTIAPNEKTATPEETSVRKTRARASSALTEENVTALNNTPSRRMTRRNSGAQEPSVTSAAALPLSGTPVRRSTRRASITSDDNASVASSTLAATRSRRNVFVEQSPSDEKETASLGTRKTPGRKSVVGPPATVLEESEVEEIEATPYKTPNRSLRHIPEESPLTGPQKSDNSDSEPMVVPEPHPVSLHKSLLRGTPIKRLSINLNRSEVLSRSTIQIVDESVYCVDASQSVVVIEDTPTNSPLEVERKGPANQTVLSTTNEEPIKDELVNDTSADDALSVQSASNAPHSRPATENVAAQQSPSVSVLIETKDTIDASHSSVAAASKSVTFAEVAVAETSAKSDDVFHDTCTDFADNDDDESQAVPDPTHTIHAGATPSRTRFNLSLRSSTPMVTAPDVVAEAVGNSSATGSRPRGRPPLNRASLQANISDAADDSEKPTEPMSRSWSQAVHGTSASQIDKSAQDVYAEEEVIKRPASKAEFADFIDDNEEEDNEDSTKEAESHNSFVDDEAEEVNGYDEDDSKDSSLANYMRENEVPVDGHSIGSEDSGHDDPDGEEDEDDEMDSFIVSDDEEERLLEGTGDDLSDGDDNDEKQVTKPRRSVLRMVDSSEDEENAVDEPEPVSVNDNDINNDSNEVADEEEPPQETATARPDISIHVSDRQTNKLLSRSVIDRSVKKTNSKLNKSLNTTNSHTTDIDFSAYVEKAKAQNKWAKSNSTESDSSIVVPERQITKLLSNSVLEVGKRNKKNSKLNKSLGTAMETNDVNITRSEFIVEKKGKLLPQDSEEVIGDTVQDVEMESPPKVKTPKAKTTKVKTQKIAVASIDAIMDRCQSLLAQNKEARRNDKLQNKKEVSEEEVERIKSKKQQKQLEKARRAANLLKLQQEEAERIKRKEEKKLLKKSKVTDPAQEISTAIAHGIEILSKSKRARDPEVLISTKTKKNQRDPIDDEIQSEIPLPQTKKPKKIHTIEPTIESLSKQHEAIPSKQKKSKKTISTDEPLKEIVAKKSKKITPPSESSDDHQQENIISKKKKHSKKVEKQIEPQEVKVSKKGKRLLDSDESILQSVPKKLKVSKVEKKRLLNILTPNSSSEQHESEPIKLPKKPTEYNVLQVRSVAAAQQTAVSRKRKPVAPPSPLKPEWTSAGEFVVSKLPVALNENVHHHKSSFGTEFAVTSLSKKRKIRATTTDDAIAGPSSVNAQVAEYRAKMSNGDRVKRETTAQMLQHKKKMQAYTRF